MLEASWVTLIRRIPANLHDGLVLTLTTGAEVVVQRFVKLEAEYAILCGRMAGTQDNGRIVVLPYSNLVAVNVTRRLTEPETEAIFGKDTEAFAAAAPIGGEPGEHANGAADEEGTEEQAAKPAMPSKTALLKKLRERLRDASRG
jgi:hypothetical protein